MKIEVFGNINKYYVQTLCMIFFPGVKFSESEAYDDGLFVTVKVNENELGAVAEVELVSGDKLTSAV